MDMETLMKDDSKKPIFWVFVALLGISLIVSIAASEPIYTLLGVMMFVVYYLNEIRDLIKYK